MKENMKRSGYFEEVTLDEFIFRCSVVNLVCRNSLVTKEKRTKFRLNLMDSQVISCTQQNTRTIIMNKLYFGCHQTFEILFDSNAE